MRRARILTLPLVGALAFGCGLLAEKGEESRGTENLPSQGIGPWVKYDQECPEEQDVAPGQDPDLALQPIVVRAPRGRVYTEPWMVLTGSTEGPEVPVALFYEDRTGDRSEIRRADLIIGPGEFCRGATLTVVGDEVVFTPAGGFEGERVGAPTVLLGESLPGVQGLDTTFALYYEGGGGAGIGLAVSPDGRTWTRVGPDGRATGSPTALLTPVETGWEAGEIGSPAIARRPDGELLLYFDGNRRALRSIGLATSGDGVGWTRIDGLGNTGPSATPIVTPTFEGIDEQTNWEFLRSDDPLSGSVGTPTVLLDRGPIRDIFILYYTGNLRGPLLDDYDSFDSSLGAASSLDGVTFRKASTLVEAPAIANEVNPILNEVFPLCLSNDDLTCVLTAVQPLFDQFHGEGGFCTLPENEFAPICSRFDGGDGEPGSGSSNATSPLFIVDEVTPSVIRLGGRFVLAYHQQSDALNFGNNGIAFALNNF